MNKIIEKLYLSASEDGAFNTKKQSLLTVVYTTQPLPVSLPLRRKANFLICLLTTQLL